MFEPPSHRTSSICSRIAKITSAVAAVVALAVPAAATPSSGTPVVSVSPSVVATSSETTTGPTAASRITFWTGCADLAALSDAKLDQFASMGVGGFACKSGWLWGMGGDQTFTPDPSAGLSGSSHRLQKSLRDSNIVARLHARGMKVYLTSYLVNYSNLRTPMKEWFDDAGWSGTVLPAIGNLAATASMMGFDGIGFDQELYPQRGNVRGATWSVHYPGNTHTDDQVRAEVRLRGQQVMGAILNAFPAAQLVVYDTLLPQTWNAYVQSQVNHIASAWTDTTQLSFWDGMTSVEGYSAIRFYEATFYKTTHISRAGWDTALRYDENNFYALLSRSFSDWAYAAPRVSDTPFAWIDNGTSNFEQSRTPDYVAAQLQAFRRWGVDNEFAVYAYRRLANFDYRPYAAGLKAASEPGDVDDAPPTLSLDGETISGDSATLAGSASDNSAVRFISWQTDQASGTASLTSSCPTVDTANPSCTARWTASVPADALLGGTIVAEDTYGNRTALSFGPPAGADV